jgi:hypothetical protein
MNRLTLILAMVILASGVPLRGQQARKEADANSTPQPCLIVKHKGTVGRRLIWTAVIGVPIAPGAKYDLVDSVGYKPDKTHYKGKQLKALQKQGVHVIVLKKHYTTQDVDSARQSCRENNEPAASDGKEDPSSTAAGH